jgi:hypothetical protein
MTEQRRLKQRVRARMTQTGESYTTARRHVLAKGAREEAPPPPAGLVYGRFGTDQHHDASLVRNVLGAEAPDEAVVAGLAGGIGFMYFVFEYGDTPPLLTIVAQHHPEPWVPAALTRLGVPFTERHSSRPRWDRVRAALDDGCPVLCTVDRTRLPWHGLEPGAGADPYTVAVAGYEGDTLYVDDESAVPHRIGTQEFGAAWSAYRKGRHAMLVPTGPPTGAPGVEDALATTGAHLTGPVLGNRFDVNFGLSGMEKLAAQLRDARTKTGWERRFGDPVPFFHGMRRLYECLETDHTAPGGTRPLYAEFLEGVDRREAAELIRESGRGWERLAALAAGAGAGLGAYTELCERRMALIMAHGDGAREEVRVLGEEAERLAAESEVPGAESRRELFDEMASLVEECATLERRAVTLW